MSNGTAYQIFFCHARRDILKLFYFSVEEVPLEEVTKIKVSTACLMYLVSVLTNILCCVPFHFVINLNL